jgi:hypothetical protein
MSSDALPLFIDEDRDRADNLNGADIESGSLLSGEDASKLFTDELRPTEVDDEEGFNDAVEENFFKVASPSS